MKTETLHAKSNGDPIGAWIEKLLRADPPRAKSLVVTIFGDSIAPHGGSIWLASLIELLRPFGVNERLVRSSVFRLSEEEWLKSQRHGRRSRYEFTASGRKRFERAHAKIYLRPRRVWDGRWTVLIAPSAMVPAGKRTLLKREVLWEGFRSILPGTFFHPAGDRAAVEEILDRTRLRPYVIVSSMEDSDYAGTSPLRSLVPRHWDLAPIAKSYERFMQRLQPLADILQTGAALTPEQAFVVRTLLIHSFRRVLLHDPLLPDELLPVKWPARAAYDLCHSVYRLTYPASEMYLSGILGTVAIAPAASLDLIYR